MKVYHIREAGKGFIGHWFWFMLGALPNIPEFGKEKIYLCLNDETIPEYVTDTFEILKDKIELVPYTDTSISVECVYPNPGHKNGVDIPFIDTKVFLFLQDLFLSSIDDLNIEGYDRIYIRRNRSHFSLGNTNDFACKNIKRRQILNEDELVENLKKLNFKILNLEDYHTQEKIKIFHSASTVLGPNGGGMVHTFASKPKTKYIEILPENPHQYIDQYKHQCKALNLDFHRFQEVSKEDHLDNMKVNIDSLMNYLERVL